MRPAFIDEFEMLDDAAQDRLRFRMMFGAQSLDAFRLALAVVQ